MKSFLVGMFFGVLICLGGQWLVFSHNADTQVSGTRSTDQTTNEPQKPALTFYEDFLNLEVLVPEPVTTEAKPEFIYYLQAASFRNKEDADRARAQLILLNLEVTVSEGRNGENIWHRIIVGPFEGQSTLSKAQKTLLENGYGGMVLKRPK